MRRPFFTPITNTPRSYEWSQFHTQRDNHSTLKQWKDSVLYSKQINSLTQLVQELQRTVLKIQQPRLPTFEFHPFKIYTLPNGFRPNQVSGSFNPFDNWRTVKVRNGAVLTKYIDPFTSSVVAGTDGVTYVDGNYLPNPLYTGDILVPVSSSQFWFWIQAYTQPTTSYQLRYGANPAISSTGNPDPWTTWPTASSTNFVIGYADTLSSASINQTLIRQYQRTDILNSGHDNYITMSLCIDGSPVPYFVDAYPSGSTPPSGG